MEECTAAKESARLLGDALVYTRPEELDHKPVIRVSNIFGCDKFARFNRVLVGILYQGFPCA